MKSNSFQRWVLEIMLFSVHVHVCKQQFSELSCIFCSRATVYEEKSVWFSLSFIRLVSVWSVNVSWNLWRRFALWFCETDTYCAHYRWGISNCFGVDSSFNYRAKCHKKYLVIYYLAVGSWWCGGWCCNHMGRWAGRGGGAAYGSEKAENMKAYLSPQDGKYLALTRFYCWKKWLRSKTKTDLSAREGITLTYVSGSGRHGSPPLGDKLVRIKANLNDVVEQSQERSQWECCYKDCGKAKLENCRGKNHLDEGQRMSHGFLPSSGKVKYNTSKDCNVLPISRYSSTSPWAFMGCRFQSLSHCGSWALLSTFCPPPPPFFIFLRDHQFCSKLKK